MYVSIVFSIDRLRVHTNLNTKAEFVFLLYLNDKHTYLRFEVVLWSKFIVHNIHPSTTS